MGPVLSAAPPWLLNAAKQRPVADDSSGITSPRRKLTGMASGVSCQCTRVGPRLPQTARAMVWPVASISAGKRSRAILTASRRDKVASPKRKVAGPSS